MRGIIKVTSVVVGTIIGAGFISGQEIYSFFNKYGEYGQIGILIAIGMIGLIISKTLKIIFEKRIINYEDFLYKITKNKNKIIIYTIKNIINLFLIISYFIMCSAFSTYYSENFNIPRILGGLTISILSYCILKRDIKTIIKTNEILMPFIIVFIIIIGIIISSYNLKIINSTNETSIFKAIVKGLLYSNFNCITLIPMLISLKNEINDRKQIRIIGILSFFVLYLLIETIYMLQARINVNNSEMPMLEVCKNISTFFVWIYGVIISIAILTSVVSSAYSLIHNININKKIILFLLCTMTIPISTLPFSSLVNLAYPIFGLLGIIQIFFIIKT